MCSVSIIIPVYNTEQYLPRCIESILNQSFNDFELLLVDDGSLDASGSICDDYVEKDSRIKVFHKKNGGVSSARNLGLDNAQGEWVAFVDSDDLLPKDSLERLMQDAGAEMDMVYGSIRKFDDRNDNVETIVAEKCGVLTIEQCLDGFIAPRICNKDWQRYLFNRLYRLSIINEYKLRFRSDIFYKEDGLFVVQYLCRCKNKVVCVPNIVYLYRQVNTSAMGSLATYYNERLLTNVDSHGYIIRELKKFGVCKDLIGREVKEVFGNYGWISSIMSRTGVYNRKNRHLLLKKTIKNAGVVNFVCYFFVPRCWRKIKNKLSL